MTAMTGSGQANPRSSQNVLNFIYRDSAIPPILEGHVAPSPVMLTEPLLPACPP
jgi:hypothetical protein